MDILKAGFLLVTLLINIPVIAREQLNAEAILRLSIDSHDPSGSWYSGQFSAHIQEPRVGNPTRYSTVSLAPDTGEFRLLRNREKSIASYRVDAHGKSHVLLDGQVESNPEIVKKYRLQADRSYSYRHYYQQMLGLPMSLQRNYKSISRLEDMTFNNRSAHVLKIKLKKPVFTDTWIVYIDNENHRYLGMDIINHEQPEFSERLLFSGDFQWQQLSIPRFHHWYFLNTGEYLGSDILMELPK